MKVYLSGPISGLTHDEYTLNFELSALLLLGNDHEPVNPLHVRACHDEDCNKDEKKPDGSYLHSWQCYLKYDIISMLDCQGIALLPNWQYSKGARLEQYIAEQLGMTQFIVSNDYKFLTEWRTR